MTDLLSPAEWEALALSLRVAVVSMLGCLPVALALAFLLARFRFPGKALLDGLIHLPLVVPPVVVGYLLLVLLGRKGIVGAWLYDVLGISIAFTWKGAAVAAAVMALPLAVRAMRLAIESVDRGLEDAAKTLGAQPLKVFATVTMPLIAPGILVGALLAFARALGEFGATITFVSNIPGETQTIPLALYAQIQTPGGEAAAARLAGISIAVALIAMVASEYMARRIRRSIGGVE